MTSTGPRGCANHAGCSGQWLVEPTQARFVYFHPVMARGLLDAMPECAADTVLIYPCIVAMLAKAEQRPEKIHGPAPFV